MGFPDLNFSSLLNLVAQAAKRDGIELSQDEIDKAVKKLQAAQEYLDQHGLQEDETAEGRFGSSPLGQTMSSQHRRVYGIMARSLNSVSTIPGSMDVTRTGVPIRSIFKPSLIAFSAALVAQ